ncbi:MAG: circularly permuted type 2 ATP-grasp protein, partial [Planctomycetota bacterium]
SDWAQIESALTQRANLLNLLLSDIYGNRKLFADGVLPPKMLFGHPHYNLPYHGLPTPGGKHLHFYAAEVIRSPQGSWWLKTDRTDAPGGSGFALENRIAISRAFPKSFRNCNVQRLAPFFIALRKHLASLAKTNQENPHIALLSSGARSNGYFEDSFLARYLGFTLVESSDLVVRSGRVMLKTLAGLVPIDVLFRRHQGNSIDPLELGGDAIGIPGILQVIRDEKVVVANAPGSGLVESPVFMAFMPRICQALLGIDLKMPGIATWWGGEASSLELILDRVDEIDLLPAFRLRSLPGSRLKHLTNLPNQLKPERMTRDERIRLIRKNPFLWVAQEKIARSSSAVWENGKVLAGHLSLRAFVVSTDESVISLPGGMVRVSAKPYESQRNPFEGGGTKDAWVLAKEPVEPTSLLKNKSDSFEIIRTRGFIPSRIADNLCWLGRYLERAEASARLLRAVANRLTSETSPDDQHELTALLRGLAQSGQIDAGYSIHDFSKKLPPIESSLPKNALDQDDPNSLRYQVDRIVALAGTVRDRLSVDAWRIIQEMSSSFNSSDPKNCDSVDLLDSIETLLVGLAAFSGFVSECMTRSYAFSFLNIGRRLEHAIQTAALLKNCLTGNKNIPGELLEAILEISESGLTYRARYFSNLQIAAVFDLLLLDESNPRSIAYQVRKLVANLESLPGNSIDPPSDELQLANESRQSLQTADIFKLCVEHKAGDYPLLIQLLEFNEKKLSEVATAINNRFFVHSGPVHQWVVDDTPTP